MRALFVSGGVLKPGGIVTNMTGQNAIAESSDEVIRLYLTAALEHLLAAGLSAHELVAFSLQKFGKDITPHLAQLQADIREGRVDIAHLGGSPRTAIFAMDVTPEQWEEMVREAAHCRAEGRGSAEGSPEEDWYAAEEEIEVLIERQAGLLERAAQHTAPIASTAASELRQIAEIVEQWRNARGAVLRGALPSWFSNSDGLD